MECAGTLLTIYHFKDGLSRCFSFISHIYLEGVVSLVYGLLRKGFVCNNVSWSLLMLFLNILYVDLLMLKLCICKLCPKIEIDRLGGMLIWFYSCMAFYLEHYFLLIYCCVNWFLSEISKSLLDLQIIKHCRKSLLHHENETWKKKNWDNCFDVTMGSYDEAEVCELVGILLLSTLAKKLRFI